MCVNNLSKVALDSAAAGIEPAISSRRSNALTTTRATSTISDDRRGHFEGNAWERRSQLLNCFIDAIMDGIANYFPAKMHQIAWFCIYNLKIFRV